jgi:hemoglobin-like flavoprotein/Ran GTPase-activating protein (RanGAP) involved in mRNA processing and transport
MNVTTPPAPPVTSSFCPHCLAVVAAGESSCEGCRATRPGSGWPRDRRIGATIAGGQYQVVRRLGSGGFGTVYLVRTTVGGLQRALKILHTEWAGDAVMRERFVHEAVVLEQIHHPNVARCHGVGTLDDEPELYLALEFVEGASLARTMGRADGVITPLAPARAVRIAKQVASGLAAAHAVDVLHRDLKPENVLLSRAGTDAEQAKIIDFGIAKSLQRTAAPTSARLGTPQFMAPEQLTASDNHDARLDLWQLGAVLFFMLTGRAPYADAADGPALTDAFQAHLDAGPRPSERVPELRAYPALDDLVSRLLATDPDRRPRTAGTVCSELARVEHQLAPAPAHNPLALLEALCAAPGEGAWWALCRYLLEQPADTQPGLIDVADTLVADWPDHLRVAPVAWWEAEVSGHAQPLWSLARALDLSGRDLDDADIGGMAASGALASVTRLNLSHNQITAAGARRLAESPGVRGLAALDLSHNRLTSAGLAALSASSSLSRLTELNVTDNGIGVEGAEALARASWRLTRLDLGFNDIGATGAALLAASPILRHVEVLGLAGNALGSDGAGAIAMSREMTSLSSLDLSGNAIGASGAAALALSPALAGLRHLGLGRNRLGPAGMELLSSIRLPALEILDVAANELGAHGAMLLAASPTVRRVKSLDVSDNELGDAGLAALLGAPALGGLRELSVARNGVTEAGVTLVGTAPLELTRLDVSGNALGDAGAAALGRALSRTRVSSLGLAHAGMTGHGLAALVEHAGGRLEHLDVSGNRVDADAASALADLGEARALVSLDLSACQLDAPALVRLSSAHRLSALQRLSLASNKLIDDDGPTVVGALERFPAVSAVCLADNALATRFLDALVASSLPSRLHALDLGHGSLADEDVGRLIAAAWPTLRRLSLQGNRISQAGAATLLASPALPLLAELDLGRNVLKGGVDLHSLSRKTVDLMESSFAVIAARGTDFAARFYRELFARHPAVQPLFARVSMRQQQQHLLAALTMVIDHLRTPDVIAPAVEALGRRHVGYRVQASHYVAVTHVALDVIRETLGDQWTPEVDEAWHRGLDAVSAVMLAAHQQTLQEAKGG